VLNRPYPQAVAGTPERWSWDPATKTFQLVFSTKPAGAKRATYTPTEIWIPRRHYLNGYRAEVTGARVVSKPNKQLLLLRGKRAAGRVTVKVTPR
jgi:endoglycosylceramidase